MHYYWCYIGHKIPAFIADTTSFCVGQRPMYVSCSVHAVYSGWQETAKDYLNNFFDVAFDNCFDNCLRNIIPFILLPITEWTEWKECGLLGIDRIRVLLGTFWRENPRGRALKCVGRYSCSQVTSRPRSVLYEIEILCILLFVNRNKNTVARIAPKEYTLRFNNRASIQEFIRAW